MNNNSKSRIFWLDIARVCAVFCISLNHAVNRAFNPYNQMEEFVNSSLLMQIVKAILTTCSWFGVPLFLMITGTLFLKKNLNSEEDIKRLYKRNIIPTLISAMLWLFLGYLFITLFIDGTVGEALSSTSNYILNLIHTVLFFNTTSFASLYVFLGFIFSFSATVLCQLYGYSQPYDLTTSYDSVGILVSSFFLFEIFRRYARKILEFRACITFISQRAFGVYMLHIFIIEFIRKHISNYGISHSAQLLIYWIVSIVLSLVIIRILECNSWCKKKLMLIKD